MKERPPFRTEAYGGLHPKYHNNAVSGIIIGVGSFHHQFT